MKNRPRRTTIGLDKRDELSRPSAAELRKARLPRGFRTPALLHHQRRAAHAAPGHRPGRDAGVGRLLRLGHAHPWPRPGPLPHAAPAGEGARAASRGARPAVDRFHQHHRAGAGTVVPRRRVRRTAHPRLYPVERGDHGVPRQPARPRRGRAHRDLCVGGLAVRGRVQSLLPRQGPWRVRRPGVLPGTRRPGHLRPRVPRGTAGGNAARRVPAGAVPPGRRAAELPAPAADAGLLGVPDGVHGPRAAERHLPGAVQPLPARPRAARHVKVARVGVLRRRRDGRARGARRDRAGRPRGTGQPHLRHQLQPAAARRPGARQRQDHPGARGLLPGRGLERHQGHLGRDWDPLLAQDTDGVLVNKMNTTPDGQFQTYSVESGAYIREHFFGSDPRLRKMVEHLSDDDLRNLSRGGHDYRKVYAAFKAAREHVGQPTVILTHTIKGWTLGKDFEARNATHQMKKLTLAELKEFRDRLYLPIPDSELERPDGLPPYYHPGQDSDEIQYMKERRAALGGVLPRRVVRAKPLPQPPDSVYQDMMKGSGKQSVATTMAFVRILKDLMKDPVIGDRFVPVIPDEARTFGMDSLFPTAKIYSPFGQTYEAVDRNLLLSYKESERGQLLHEGISEAGAMGSVAAAGSAYATHGTHMIPVYMFYSMFGWQRTGDQMWALGDQLGRGFLLGATAGRTTLTGEGLQHNDGHSVLLASVSPACVAYDAAYAYELSYIVQDGLRRMYDASEGHPAGEDIFYYLTLYNEPYPQPPEPFDFPGGSAELEKGILRGLYKYASAPSGAGPDAAAGDASDAGPDGGSGAVQAQILASGVALRQALTAQEMLANDWGVSADVWSATSWTELRREAMACESWNMLHPDAGPRVPYVSSVLSDAAGPVVAVSDWIKAVPDQIARWVPGSFTSLGTDGFGFSDTRPAARRFFHVDAESITLAVLAELARSGAVDQSLPAQAIAKYKLDLPVSEALS